MAAPYYNNPEYDTYLGGLESERAIPPGTLRSMMMTESGGDPSAVSPAGARGLFQFMGPTAKQYGLADPHDPQESGRAAADYYEYLLNQFGDDETALAAYNFGEGNIRSGKPLPKETRDYIKRVKAGIPDPEGLSNLMAAFGEAPDEGAPPEEGGGEEAIVGMMAAFDESAPPVKKVPKSEETVAEAFKAGFKVPGLTENIIGAALDAPMPEDPELDRTFGQSAAYYAGRAVTELTDPVGLALTFVPGARVGSTLAARAARTAALGGGYEAGAATAEEARKKGFENIDVGAVAERTLIGAAAGPILEEGVRVAGKVAGDAWSRYRGAKEAESQDLVTTAIEKDGEVPDAEFDPYATEEPPTTKGIEVEELTPEDVGEVGMPPGDKGAEKEPWEDWWNDEDVPTTDKPTDAADVTWKPPTGEVTGINVPPKPEPGRWEGAVPDSDKVLDTATLRPGFESYSHDLHDVITNPKVPNVKSGDLDEVLDRITKIGESPWQKKIAAHLKGLNLGARIRMRSPQDLMVKFKGQTKEALGQYWTKQKMIDINSAFLEEGGVAIGAHGMSRTIIHEATHSATHVVIDSGAPIAKKWDELYRYARGFGRTLTKGGEYGFESAHEFIAEAFSNPEFQDLLRKIPPLNPTGKIRTMWDQFINTVRISLKLPPNTPRSVLEEAIEGGLDIMKVQKRMQKDVNAPYMSDAYETAAKFQAHQTGTGKNLDTMSKEEIDKLPIAELRQLQAERAARKAAEDVPIPEGVYNRPKYLGEDSAGQHHVSMERVDGAYRLSGTGATKEEAMVKLKQLLKDDVIRNQKKLSRVLQQTTAQGPAQGPDSVQSLASKVAQAVAPLTGGRSIRAWDVKGKLSPTFRELRRRVEHFQEFELRPGEKAIPDFTELVQRHSGQFRTALDKVFDPLRTGVFKAFSAEARKALTKQIREGSTSPAAKQVRKILDDIHAYAKKAGLDLGYIENYFPRMYRTEILKTEKGAAEFKKALMEYDVDAEDADEILRTIISEDGFDIRSYQPSKGNRPGAPAWKKSRALADIPDGALEKFLHNDPRTVLHQYSAQVVRRAEHARIFGNNGEVLDKAIKQIKRELAGKGSGLTEAEEKQIRGLSQALIGRYNPILSHRLQTATRMVSAYQLIRTLPMATLSSLSEPFIALEHGGARAFANGLMSGIGYAAKETSRSIFKGLNKSNIRMELEDMGLIVDNSLTDTLREASGGLSKKIGLDEPGIGALRNGKWVDLFFKANMLEPWTNFTRSIAIGTGKKSMQNTVKGFMRNPNGVMGQRLRELGVDGPEAAEWFKRTGGDFTVTDPYQANMKTGLTRFVNDVVMSPRATTKPLWMSDPHWHLVAQLKSYQTTFGNTVGRRWFENMKRAGKSPEDLAKAAYSVGTAGVMTYAAMMSNDLREKWMYGEKGNPRFKNEKPMARVARAMDRAGLTGGLQPAFDMFGGERFGKPGLVQVLGPTATQAVDVVEGVHDVVSKGKPRRMVEAAVEGTPGYFALPSRTKKQAMKGAQRGAKRFSGKTRYMFRKLKRTAKRVF